MSAFGTLCIGVCHASRLAEIKAKRADRPGSVLDSHSSRRFVTISSSNLPASDASNIIACLSSLAWKWRGKQGECGRFFLEITLISTHERGGRELFGIIDQAGEKSLYEIQFHVL